MYLISMKKNSLQIMNPCPALSYNPEHNNEPAFLESQNLSFYFISISQEIKLQSKQTFFVLLYTFFYKKVFLI